MEKKFTFEHEKIAKLLEDKNTLVKDGIALSKDIEELEQKRAKVGHKIQKLKDKVVPTVKKELFPSLVLEEFEEVQSIDLEDGKVVLKVVDRVEEFKDALRKAKEDGASGTE